MRFSKQMMARLLACALLLTCLAPARAQTPARRFERMAALQETLVSIHERGGLPGMLTYAHNPEFWLDNVALGKLQVGIESEGASTRGEISWLSGTADLRVANLADGAGVKVSGTVSGHRVRVEVLPTARGRDTMQWEGAALFKVTCVPPAKLLLRYGGVGRVRIHGFHPALPLREDFLLKPDFLPVAPADTTFALAPNGGALGAKDVAPKVFARFVLPSAEKVEYENGFLKTASTREVASAYVVAGFAENAERAQQLTQGDPPNIERECRARFADLHRAAWIQTPSPSLDGAFAASLNNLEYAWVRPYGWIESLHHWGTFYSQQQSLAADWIGQQNRSREMLLAHAAHLLPLGQVPQLDPNGRARLDFGGWNQFYVWDVQHLWRASADRDFARKIAPTLARVVDQTFTEGDADGNDLLGFGQQIGNQEDYVSTPRDGTSPTLAGIEMKRTQAEIARALGNENAAREYSRAAQRLEKTLRAELWDADLGRFIFYRDALGVRHLDGQYHTFIWPVIFDVLDPLDSYTSMRHLNDTLTGSDGQIYASNNFPVHVAATVGSQAGGQQQPWATFGWAKLGDGEKAVAPLEWIARLVTNEANAGAWPEVSEDLPAYFTPPAGVYVQGVVEGVFGLRENKPDGTLDVAPCLPRNWPQARLHLPQHDLTVTQSARSLRIESASGAMWRRRFRVALPPSSRIGVTLNGRVVPFQIEAGVARQWVVFQSAPSKSATVEIRFQPLGFAASAPREVARGASFTARLAAKNARVLAVRDPSGVLASSRIE
ncbi:MAG: hypothetical protein ACR2MB_09875, partial [Acidimicrobiales bacterium]